MSGVRGLVLGVAGLALAEAVVSNTTATSNAGGAITLISHGLARWLNPYVPLIPDLTASTSSAGGTTGKFQKGTGLQPMPGSSSGGAGGTPARPVSGTLPPGAGAGVSTGQNI